MKMGQKLTSTTAIGLVEIFGWYLLCFWPILTSILSTISLTLNPARIHVVIFSSLSFPDLDFDSFSSDFDRFLMFGAAS